MQKHVLPGIVRIPPELPFRFSSLVFSSLLSFCLSCLVVFHLLFSSLLFSSLFFMRFVFRVFSCLVVSCLVLNSLLLSSILCLFSSLSLSLSLFQELIGVNVCKTTRRGVYRIRTVDTPIRQPIAWRLHHGWPDVHWLRKDPRNALSMMPVSFLASLSLSLSLPLFLGRTDFNIKCTKQSKPL